MNAAVLHDFIAVNRLEIIERCRSRVAERQIPPAVPTTVTFGVATFLDELLDALRPGQSQRPPIAETAGQHGRDLLDLGSPVSAVVHDYGDIGRVVGEMAIEQAVSIEATDFRILNECIDEAIAAAVTEFGRDEQSPASGEPYETSERRRAASDQLRQSIQTATVALEVLKLGTADIDGATGKVLEQSLVDARNVVQTLLTDEK